MAERSPRPVLSLHSVTVEYRTPAGAVTAVEDVSITVPGTGITVLSGPSGSGKSTLLRILSLVDRPSFGTVELDGKVVSGFSHRALRRLRRNRIALMVQNPVDNLLAQLTVGDNLRAAAQTAHRPPPGPQLLETLGLAGTGGWRIPALSGGQQQRLAFGCALARGAGVLLADEPTPQLDTASADLVLQTLTALAERSLPVVVASHDPRLVALSHTLIRLRDGRVDTDQAGAVR
ncbi:MAG: ABC transporter ATP-binding protein [Sciscionella sp.]